MDEHLLEVRGLETHLALKGKFLQRLLGREDAVVRAVDGVSFTIAKGEVFGLVGESGSGKTTLGRTILGLTPATAGSVRFQGAELTRLAERDFRPYRKRIQLVFQDPHASLNPAMTIGAAVEHPLAIHGVGDRASRKRLVRETLERVGLAPASRYLQRYPRDLSGGQKQRAAIARAIIVRPELLIADEPVSMLDMSVRARILDLLLELKAEFDLTFLYITHDLATARFFCDHIGIMYLGRMVEAAPAHAIYSDPKHPYTRSLLAAIPEMNPRARHAAQVPRGEVPDATAPPLGCRFHPRCPHAFKICGWEPRDFPALLEHRSAAASPDEALLELRLLGAVELTSTNTLRIRADRGQPADEVAALLGQVRERTAADPFWLGVRQIATGASGIEIEFHERVDVRDTVVGSARVECHLFDAEARAAAA